MAVSPMLRANIYGLKKDRKKILEALQRRGAVDVRAVTDDNEKISRPDTSQAVREFLKAVQLFNQALSVIEDVNPENKSIFESLKGKRELSLENYYTFVNETDSISREAKRTLTLSKRLAEANAESTGLLLKLKSLEPWKKLDVPLNFKGTQKTFLLIGVYAEKKTLTEILEMYEAELIKQGKDKANDRLWIDAELVSADENQTCCVIFCERNSLSTAEKILRETGFAKPPVSTSRKPSEEICETEERLEEIEREKERIKNELKALAGMRSAFKFMIDYYSMRAEKYEVLGKIGQTKNVFFLTGYLPKERAGDIEAEITRKYSAAVEFEVPTEDENVPVLLKNNSFAAPCEGVLETFSMPSRGELDPTFVMSLFYYLLFGLMLSDLGYGIIMIAGCGFALMKFRNMDTGLKKTLKMFLYCGISTAFWGAMFGGFFGDAVAVISGTYFGKEISFKPLWFEPISDPMKMLAFSFAIGIVHLFTGLFMKLVTCIKNKQYKAALYDVVFWYMLVGGGIAYLLSAEMFVSMLGLSFKLSPSAAKLSVVTAACGAIGILLTGGRSSRNPVKRLLKGAYELYNVTGYLSDILSYSRLLALGLATGVISQVFNKMGSMLGSGVIGFILFMAVFIIGHTLNIGINLLGAYVHTNRLQFVEFFGKFYEGGGEKYSPFSANTKYFKIREDV